MVNNLDVIANGNLYTPIAYTNPEVEWLFGPCAVANHWEYQPATAPDFRALWDQRMTSVSWQIALSLRMNQIPYT